MSVTGKSAWRCFTTVRIS